MAKFQNLTSYILWRIAKELVRDLHRYHRTTVKLLPLRLIHPQFTPSITHWIYETIRVKADESLRSISAYGSHWNSFSWLMNHIIPAGLHIYVTNLIFTINGTEGALTITAKTKIHQSVAALLAVSTTLRSVHLCGQVLDSQEYIDAWQSLPAAFSNLDKPFRYLFHVTLGGCFLPLLSCLVGQSPRIGILCIGEDPKWVGKNATVYRYLQISSSEPPPYPRIRLLCIENASKHDVLSFLRALSISAKHIRISVSIWDPNGIFELVQGIETWSLFTNVGTVTVYTEHPQHRRLIALCKAFEKRKVLFLFKPQYTPSSPASDGEPAAMHRRQIESVPAWTLRAPVLREY